MQQQGTHRQDGPAGCRADNLPRTRSHAGRLIGADPPEFMSTWHHMKRAIFIRTTIYVKRMATNCCRTSTGGCTYHAPSFSDQPESSGWAILSATGMLRS